MSKIAFSLLLALMLSHVARADINLIRTPAFDTQIYNQITMDGYTDSWDDRPDKCVIDCDESYARQSQTHQQRTPDLRASKNDLTFVTDRRVRQAVYDQLFNESMKADLRAANGTEDIIGLIGPAIAPYGLKTNNIADALTVWAIYGHDLINGTDSNVDRRTVQSLKSRFEASLLVAPQLTNVSDKDHQKFADTLLIHAFVYYSALEGKNREPAAFAETQDVARELGKQLGIDLDALHIQPGTGLQ